MKLLGKEVPALGMGCWAIGGAFYKGDIPLGFANVDDDTSIRTIHAACDAGIQVFDTAAVYGAGHSEIILGTALKGRQDVVVMSKLGTAIDEATKQVLENETCADSVMPAIDASLGRLQRDCIDIILLHLNGLSIEVATPLFIEMHKAVEAGKVRAFGWSTDFPQSVQSMAGKNNFVAVEHAMNVFLDAPSLQAVIEENDLIAFIRSPLAMGILTGKFDATSVMESDDVRSINNDRRDYFFDGKVAPKYLRNISAIKELLQIDGRTLAQGALGWLLAKSTHNMPLPGARTVKQVTENAGALSFGPLPSRVMAEIETLIQREPEGEARAR